MEASCSTCCNYGNCVFSAGVEEVYIYYCCVNNTCCPSGSICANNTCITYHNSSYDQYFVLFYLLIPLLSYFSFKFIYRMCVSKRKCSIDKPTQLSEAFVEETTDEKLESIEPPSYNECSF